MSAITYTRVEDYDGADDFTKKHTPLISAARDGDTVTVTVEVGRDVPHPNATDHYITFIELYSEMAPIARFDLFPAVSAPRVSVVCLLPEGAKVTAVEHCNLHGVWAYDATV
jgi:superoxide reductase